MKLPHFLILSSDFEVITLDYEPSLWMYLPMKYLLELPDFLWSYYLDILVLSVNWNSFYDVSFMWKKIAENGICTSAFNRTFVCSVSTKMS